MVVVLVPLIECGDPGAVAPVWSVWSTSSPVTSSSSNHELAPCIDSPMKVVSKLELLPPRVDANCQAVHDPRIMDAPGEAVVDSVPYRCWRKDG